MDFSSIHDGLSLSTAVTAIIAAGALIATVGFGKWATKKVATFFDAAERRSEIRYYHERDTYELNQVTRALQRQDMSAAIDHARGKR